MASVFELVELSAAAYAVEGAPPGWVRGPAHGRKVVNRDAGLYAAVFTRVDRRASGPGHDRVLAYRGTEGGADRIDLLDDYLLARGDLPYSGPAAVEAAATERASRGPGGGYYLTGHSLGGGLASLAGMRLDVPHVTFNAPGMLGSCLDLVTNLLTEGNAVSCVAGAAAGGKVRHVRTKFDPLSLVGFRMGAGRDDVSLEAACTWHDVECNHSVQTLLRSVAALPGSRDDLGW